MRLRQSIEGDIIITLEDVSSGSCWFDGNGNYVPESLTLIHNSEEYPIISITGYSAGFLAFTLPSGLFLTGGDVINVVSECDSDETGIQTVLDINFRGVGLPSNITTCSDRPSVTVGFDDIIRLFLQSGASGYFTLNLNGESLDVSNFTNQPDYTGVVTSPSGVFTPDVADNVVMFSNDLYPVNNNLQIEVESDDTYFTVRLGFVEVIFNNGTLTVNNYATGAFNQLIGTYEVASIISIGSNASTYIISDATGELYTASKTISLTGGLNSGSATPSLIGVGDTATWNFSRTYTGKQTLLAQIGTNIRIGFEMNVTSCDVAPVNQTLSANRGDVNKQVPTLTFTGEPTCEASGFRLQDIPSCLTVKVNGVVATEGLVFGWANRSSITYDVSNDCADGSLIIEFDIITSTPGCFSSTNGTITISISNCPEEWIRTGQNRCNNCEYQVEEIDINSSCSGSEGTRWVVSAEGSCTEEFWEDTGQTRCEDCISQKEQRQINDCLTIPNRWVAGGNACNYNAVWEVQSDTFCAECVEYGYYKDVNPCSATYNSVRVFENPTGNSCNNTPDWQATGQSKCINFIEHYEVRDVNPCSPTYRQLDYIITPNQNRCEEECDDVLFISKVCEDQCAENEQAIRAIPHDIPCDIKFLQPQISGDRVILYVANSYGNTEYSNDGFSWTTSPIFYITTPGKTKYYARREYDSDCVTEISVVHPDLSKPVSPFEPSEPPVYGCDNGNETLRYENAEGQVIWEPTGNACDVCEPVWVNIEGVQPRCRNGYYEIYQEDGCGRARWNPSNRLCNVDDCVPIWVDKLPYSTICIAGYRHKYIVDGCGNEKTANTGELCGTCEKPEFELQKLSPSCQSVANGQSNIDGKITIQNFVNGDRYQWSTGINFNGDTDYNNATPIAQGSTVIDLHTFGFNVGETSKHFTVRLFNGNSNCYTDKSITVTNPCVPNACVSPTYNGVNAQKATCSPSGQPLNNAAIGIQGIQNATRYGYSQGETYYGEGCSTSLPIIGGQIAINNLTGSSNNMVYVIRLFNGCENSSCYTDIRVTVQGVDCVQPVTCKTFTIQSGVGPIIATVRDCSDTVTTYNMEGNYKVQVCTTSMTNITIVGVGGIITEVGEGCIGCPPNGLTLGYSAECKENSIDNKDSITFNTASYNGNPVRLIAEVEGVKKYDAIHASGQNYRYVVATGDESKIHIIKGQNPDNMLCEVSESINVQSICECASNPTGTISYTCPSSGPVTVSITPSIIGGNDARIIITEGVTEVFNELRANGVVATVNLNNNTTYQVRVEDSTDDSCGQTQTLNINCAAQCSGLMVLGINNLNCEQGSFDIAIGGAAYPIDISIKKVGDPTERFIAKYNDTIYYLDPLTGNSSFEITIEDANGCTTTYPFTTTCALVNPSWLTWGQSGNVCNNGVRGDWYVILAGLQNATRYRICYDSATFSCGGSCSDSDGVIDINSSNDANIKIDQISTPRTVTIRVYTNSGCTYYSDLTVTIPALPGPCCEGFVPFFTGGVECPDTNQGRVYISGFDGSIGNVYSVKRVGDPSTERLVSSTIGGSSRTVTFNTTGATSGEYIFYAEKSGCNSQVSRVVSCTPVTPCPDKQISSNVNVLWYRNNSNAPFSSYDAAKGAFCGGGGGNPVWVFVQNGASMIIGSDVWVDNNISNCDKIADGYYYRSTGDFNNPIIVIRVVGGKISEKTNDVCYDDNCESKDLDVIFLVDESASISFDNWNLLTNGLIYIFNKLSGGISSGNIRAGMVRFGSPVFPFNPLGCAGVITPLGGTVAELTSDATFYPQGRGNTPTSRGLYVSYNDIIYTRPAQKKIVLITDGDPNMDLNCDNSWLEGRASAQSMATTIKTTPKAGGSFEIITLGIAMQLDANMWLRDYIATSPSHHYSINDFSDFAAVADTLTAEICS